MTVNSTITTYKTNANSGQALTIGHYRFHFRSVNALRLPAYAGSAWRGLFGHALKQTVCVTREPDCTKCLLYRNCSYAYIFETPPPVDTDRMKRYTAAPHPFVIYPLPLPNRDLSAGAELGIEFTVFGLANAQLPYMVYAFQTAGRRGIGKHQGQFELARIEQNCSSTEEWLPIWDTGGILEQRPAFIPELPECPATIAIELQTPMRIKREADLVGPQEFAFHDLFRSLLRRISNLTYFHGKQEFTADFAGLTEESRNVNLIGRDLRWQDWSRYSSRQQSTMQMGGLIGTMELHGTDIRPFWPLLWLGQWTHAGKGASMGLGRYRIHDPASLPIRTTTKD